MSTRVIARITDRMNGREAVIRYNRVWNEYSVKMYAIDAEGKREYSGEYFTDEEADARDTANYFCRNDRNVAQATDSLRREEQS